MNRLHKVARFYRFLLMVGVVLALYISPVTAQRTLESLGDRARSIQNGQGDSLQHRTGLEDSITIRFRFLDTSSLHQFDSTIYDFTDRFPIPWSHVHLGNLGNATRDLIFTPTLQSGWDAGYHAFDVYNFTMAETRFYNTTRPYSELGYLLGAQSEQMIHLLHTQNIKPNWNAAFQYRMINAPGFFQNQNTNDNSYRLTSWYQSRSKRYQNFFVILGNKLQSGENGGILQDGNYLDSLEFEDRATIPTQLGSSSLSSRNFFTTNISTGTFHTNATYMMRQQYDVGQKDSIVTDTSVIPLFYPRLRFEHTISYNTWNNRFVDNQADSTYYYDHYNILLDDATDSFFRRDKWRVLTNDFSIYQFPDAKNPRQFFKVGATYQNLSGDFDTSGTQTGKYHNLWVHGEYRNKTRNQQWDIEANGKFIISGLNSGDYDAYISLQRSLGKKTGYLQVGFQNVNRTPSFVFNSQSGFYLAADPLDLRKENTTHLFGTLHLTEYKFKLSADYYLLNNYSYFRDYYQPNQILSLFNVLEISAFKQFDIGKKGWNWKTWLVLQQKAGNAPLNLPLLTTRNMIGYDGKLGYKNLLISFGAEIKYFTAYEANAYSPLLGQYFYQDTATVRLKRPDINGYLHLRIKSFTAYVRAENLNALDVTTGKFIKNNVPTLGYPYPGLQIRVGIFWSFVN